MTGQKNDGLLFCFLNMLYSEILFELECFITADYLCHVYIILRYTVVVFYCFII